MARRPVNAPYTITTEFDVPDIYAKFKRHSGVDYAVPLNRPIYAPISGVLTNVVSPTGGNMVVIYDGQFWHRLMHNQSFSRTNGSVQEGDEVAKAGSTGLSTGYHCHWDINDEGTYPTAFTAFKDPWKWLQGEYPKPITAPTLKPNQRLLSNPTGVNQRAEPNTFAPIMKEWAYDQEPFNFKGYVIGESVNGNNIWFVGEVSGGYFFSGAFQGGANTAGLTNLTLEKPAETPTPIPEPAPTPPPTNTPIVFEAELNCVTSVKPAHETNYQTTNFPTLPSGVVLHDFGTDGRDTLESSLNHFANANTTAPHFTVSGKQIVQNGKLSWRMYHAGAGGNDKIGIEIDPDVDSNPDTKRSVLILLSELDSKFGTLTRYLHSQFTATACGDDITKSNLLIPPTEPTDSTQADKDREQDNRLNAIEAFINALKKLFGGN